MSVSFEIATGNLLDQKVEVIVNAWNSNRIPWWLLQPHGVSGTIKRYAGSAPFRELQAYGALALGQAALTSAGQLSYKGIIHVASITLGAVQTQRSFMHRLSMCSHSPRRKPSSQLPFLYWEVAVEASTSRMR